MPDADQTERDRQWAEGIRTGDRSAYAALFRAYHPQLCNFAQGYVGSAEAAKDVVQEVFLQLWERRKQFDPPSTVRAYRRTGKEKYRSSVDVLWEEIKGGRTKRGCSLGSTGKNAPGSNADIDLTVQLSGAMLIEAAARLDREGLFESGQ